MDNNLENVNVSNCLALTVRKDYKLISAKNFALTSIKVSSKIALSVLMLNILSILL